MLMFESSWFSENVTYNLNKFYIMFPESGLKIYILGKSTMRFLNSVIIFANQMEATRRPRSDYMEKVQDGLTPKMREVLVAWLVEVAEEFKLVSDTLFLSISYVDLFLSSNALSRNKLQLLGVSCVLIAS